MSWGVPYPLYFNELQGCVHVVSWLFCGLLTQKKMVVVVFVGVGVVLNCIVI
jgi:hypothetical protein